MFGTGFEIQIVCLNTYQSADGVDKIHQIKRGSPDNLVRPALIKQRFIQRMVKDVSDCDNVHFPTQLRKIFDCFAGTLNCWTAQRRVKIGNQ